MSLSALGILSAAGAGGVPALVSSYELISTTVLGSNSNLVEFTGLDTYSSTYEHLQIRFTAKNSSTASTVLRVRFNNTATGYARHMLWGDATSVSSTSTTSSPYLNLDYGMTFTTTANNFAGGVADILDAYSTTKNKTLRCLHGLRDTASGIALTSGFLNDTAAISSIQLSPAANNIAAGSRFSIYGIKG
jgi:hypothetical protein